MSLEVADGSHHCIQLVPILWRKMDEIKTIFPQIIELYNFEHVSTFYNEFEFIKYILLLLFYFEVGLNDRLLKLQLC